MNRREFTLAAFVSAILPMWLIAPFKRKPWVTAVELNGAHVTVTEQDGWHTVRHSGGGRTFEMRYRFTPGEAMPTAICQNLDGLDTELKIDWMKGTLEAALA